MLNKPLLDNLNQQQLLAVTYGKGSLLILAGAGSGKTRVLTTRIAYLVQELNISLQQILAVTFTNKASKEMQERLTTLLHTPPQGMWVGTFHSIALRMLRNHNVEAGLPKNFQVLDSNDQLGLIKRLVKKLNLDEDSYPSKAIQSYINYQKEFGHRVASLEQSPMRGKNYLEIYRAYEEYCNQNGLLDFAELLLRAYELLSYNQEILASYQNKFKHILVDEFQDTNELQYKWLRLISSPKTHVCAVGDDDQSIYSFRGAKVGNMRSFLHDFACEQPIFLEQNYRSTSVILEAANAVIGQNEDRMGKNLWTDNNVQEKIDLYEGYTEEDEAYFVIDEIKNLRQNKDSLSNIAILYRSNAQSRVFEHHLYTNGIPYRVYGGLRFFDRMEIKRVLAYLRLILNKNDNEAFLRVVNFPARGIGLKSITELQRVALEQEISLFDAVMHLEGKPRQVISKFINLINDLTAISQTISLGDLVGEVISKSGIQEHFENDKKEGKERLENLKELVNAVTEFTLENSDGLLVDFLAHAILESGDKQSEHYEEAVQLMTVHSSKGLEFDRVFLVGLEDGLFPHENSLYEQKNIEEERRLMYVAITRAKKKLYLLRACSRLMWGKRTSAPISRFVAEIPSALINNMSGLNKSGYDKSDVPNPESKTSRLQLSDSDTMIKIGDIVKHAKFGNGKILRLNDDGKRRNADIFFIGVGQKCLDLNVAKIEKLN